VLLAVNAVAHQFYPQLPLATPADEQAAVLLAAFSGA